MTFSNPAGFYSLDMPQKIEQEITSFCCSSLLVLYADAVSYLNSDYDRFFLGHETSGDLDEWISNLSPTDLISLTRWIGERYAHLHNQAIKAKNTNAQAA
jgi:hypothetical protein